MLPPPRNPGYSQHRLRVLLLRPVSPNERFGLGPFFRVEPLGLEYLSAALRARGHQVEVADLRFAPRLTRLLTRGEPQLVGIACLHAVDIPGVLALARELRRRVPRSFILVGGHSASVFPEPFLDGPVDAVCTDDGERVVVELATALETGSDPTALGGLVWCSGATRTVSRPDVPRSALAPSRDPEPLDAVALPDRKSVARYRSRYLCVHKQPIWAVETARGCPYRCSFCSTWRRHERTYRVRDIDTVCRDFASTGKNVFIVDDLFFHPKPRSFELARELARRGITKDFILVQARLDTVARSPELLECWRPLARHFDIFFGFEAATDAALAQLDKDLTIDSTEAGLRVARDLGFGVTGNFVVDPNWNEADFEAMWALADRLELTRLGYTVLTPLPGTPLFEQLRAQIRDHDFSHYDMNHVLFEPRLGRRRFFELFVESWRRNVLSARHATRWWRWAKELGPRQLATLAAVLYRTQRLLDVEAYLKETFPLQLPAVGAELRRETGPRR